MFKATTIIAVLLLPAGLKADSIVTLATGELKVIRNSKSTYTLLQSLLNIDTVDQVRQLMNNNEALEKQALDSLIHNYLAEYPFIDSDPLKRPAGASLNGEYAVAEVGVGYTGTLGFFFVDTSTGLPTTGATVASVQYDVSVDPSLDVFQPIGMSTDSFNNFAFPYTVTPFEPIIRATPFDAFGNPVYIPGVDGGNIAVAYVVDVGGFVLPTPEPEPRTAPLLAVLLTGLLVASRLRTR